MNNLTQTNGSAATSVAPVAPAATYSEAPASLTLKIAYRGYADILFTLRDSSGAGLLDKLNVVIDRFEKMGITPASARNSGPATANGDAPMCPDGHGRMKASTKVTGEFYCTHSVGMHPQTGKKLYCTHKVKA